MKRKNVYFIRGFTFWNEYDMISLVYFISDVSMISLVYFIGDVSRYSNTFYHKYFGYVRVLAQLKNSEISAD